MTLLEELRSGKVKPRFGNPDHIAALRQDLESLDELPSGVAKPKHEGTADLFEGIENGFGSTPVAS